MRSHLVRFGFLPLVGVGLCLSACGSNHDDISKRLAAVQADLSRLQNHSDRLEERLEALEMRNQAAIAAARPSAPGSAGNVDRPRLTVVKLEPGEVSHDAALDAPSVAMRPEDSAADPSPRPMIRVYGSHTDVDSGSDTPKRKH